MGSWYGYIDIYFYSWGKLTMIWISVHDRLPEPGKQDFLMCTTLGGVGFGFRQAFTGKWFWADTDCDEFIEQPSDFITHWMPLPEPPSTESQQNCGNCKWYRTDGVNIPGRGRCTINKQQWVKPFEVCDGYHMRYT